MGNRGFSARGAGFLQGGSPRDNAFVQACEAPGAPQTPEIDHFRPAQNSCIKNPGVLLVRALLGLVLVGALLVVPDVSTHVIFFCRLLADPGIVRDGSGTSFLGPRRLIPGPGEGLLRGFWTTPK